MKILLASGSPRRIELLKNSGFDVRVVPSGADESYGDMINPLEIAKLLAKRKALAVKDKAESDEIIVAADTSVVIDGKILGKPTSRENAFEMLSELSGRSHSVYTGIAVIINGEIYTDCDITEVFFRKADDALIRRYIDTNEPMDKAGAYGIQKFGPALVKGIKGDYFNVMGLPLHTLFDILEEKAGISPLSWIKK